MQKGHRNDAADRRRSTPTSTGGSGSPEYRTMSVPAGGNHDKTGLCSRRRQAAVPAEGRSGHWSDLSAERAPVGADVTPSGRSFLRFPRKIAHPPEETGQRWALVRRLGAGNRYSRRQRTGPEVATPAAPALQRPRLRHRHSTRATHATDYARCRRRPAIQPRPGPPDRRLMRRDRPRSQRPWRPPPQTASTRCRAAAAPIGRRPRNVTVKRLIPD